MGTLFTIDPGVRASGWARFEGGAMASCGLAENELGGTAPPHEWLGAVDALIEALGPWGFDCRGLDVAIETMVMRTENLAAVKDLLDLNAIVGGVFARLEHAFSTSGGVYRPGLKCIYPRDWTGMRPKSANHTRIQKRLSEPELRVLVEACGRAPKSHRKEILDAVGIGLYVLKRL